MKISLITAVLNNKDTIRDTLESVLKQTYANIEYIVVDGGSTDGTVDVIKEYETLFNGRLRWVSEPDNGLYDAMNKGIRLSTGDVVGIINSDDFYTSPFIISRIASEFDGTNVEAIYGDLHFVSRKNSEKIVRYYSSKNFTNSKFKYGYMPAHPTFFTYKKYFEQWGYYNPSYKIAGDFELILRFLCVHKLKAKYLEIDFLTMRTGGLSTSSLSNILTNNRELIRACRENNIYTNYFYILPRYLIKIFEFRLFKL